MGLYKQKLNGVSGQFNLVPTSTIVTFKAAVANAAALPLSGNTLYDGRITNDNGHLYIWDGSTWLDQGDIIDLKWAAIEDKPTSSVANIDDAVSKKHSNSLDHAQGTDQGLDTGGLNATTAAQVKTAVTNSHAQHSDDQVIPDQLSDLSDDATHRLVTDTEKSTWNEITDVALNVMLNAFRIAQIGSLTIFSMVKGFMDEYEDESGIDTVNSIGEIYDSSNDFYKNWNTIAIDSETKLLLHLDNNVTDSALTPKTVTNNSVTFSSSVKKFGTHSAFFNGSGCYLSVPDSDDFSFGSDAFTIDFWVNHTALSSDPGLIGQLEDGSNFIGLYQDATKLYFGNFSSGGNFYISCPWTPSTATWYHVALVRIDNGNSAASWRIFINGVSQTLTLGLGSWNVTLTNFSAPLLIGNAALQPLFGYMDEVRVSKGIARWTSDFTPLTDAYPISIVENMTLLSNAQIATSVPTSARVVLFEEDVDAITLNTDLKVYISRDNGITFTQGTLEDEGNYITEAKVLSVVIDISTQPSGSNIKYKIETLNNKKLNIHGTGISWKF